MTAGVVVLDLVAVLVYILGTWYMRYQTVRMEDAVDRDVLEIADYTVLVRSLPKNATEEEVSPFSVSPASIACCLAGGSRREVVAGLRLGHQWLVPAWQTARWQKPVARCMMLIGSPVLAACAAGPPRKVCLLVAANCQVNWPASRTVSITFLGMQVTAFFNDRKCPVYKTLMVPFVGPVIDLLKKRARMVRDVRQAHAAWLKSGALCPYLQRCTLSCQRCSCVPTAQQVSR